MNAELWYVQSQQWQGGESEEQRNLPCKALDGEGEDNQD